MNCTLLLRCGTQVLAALDFSYSSSARVRAEEMDAAISSEIAEFPSQRQSLAGLGGPNTATQGLLTCPFTNWTTEREGICRPIKQRVSHLEAGVIATDQSHGHGR